MTRKLNQTRGLSKHDIEALNRIRTRGWETIAVFPNRPEQGPEFAYSTGLFNSFNHPEVILLGLPLRSCAGIVDKIGTKVKDGKRYEPGPVYTDIVEDVPLAFKEVHRSRYSDYVGRALWFYENDPFPLIQCFWPDDDVRFPFDAGCGEFPKRLQPLLYMPQAA
jgi:hypothetical protein